MTLASGRIVQFNSSRGYGFIEPDSGGSDVFVHCVELGEFAAVARAGMRVEFNVLRGDRGLKASDVVVVDGPPARSVTAASIPVASPVPPGPVALESTALAVDADDALIEVMRRAEFEHEITDVLIDVASAITASEIVEIRRRLSARAAQRGWIEN